MMFDSTCTSMNGWASVKLGFSCGLLAEAAVVVFFFHKKAMGGVIEVW
jgi:hypothetical protein